MDGDKLLLAGSALSGMYGAQLLSSPGKACETFYGTKGTPAERGISKWLGFLQLGNATNYAIMSGCNDKETVKKSKMAGAAFSAASIGMCMHQMDKNGFDKNQAMIAMGMNAVLGGLMLRDALKK